MPGKRAMREQGDQISTGVRLAAAEARPMARGSANAGSSCLCGGKLSSRAQLGQWKCCLVALTRRVAQNLGRCRLEHKSRSSSVPSPHRETGVCGAYANQTPSCRLRSKSSWRTQRARCEPVKALLRAGDDQRQISQAKVGCYTDASENSQNTINTIVFVQI